VERGLRLITRRSPDDSGIIRVDFWFGANRGFILNSRDEKEALSYVTWRFTDYPVQEYIDFEYRDFCGNRLRRFSSRWHFEHSCYFVKLQSIWSEFSPVRHSAIAARCSALRTEFGADNGRCCVKKNRFDTIEFLCENNAVWLFKQTSSIYYRAFLCTTFKRSVEIMEWCNSRLSNTFCLSACYFRQSYLKMEILKVYQNV